MSRETHLRHATCVSLSGAGVLILGPSGSGKSDLALRLIDIHGGQAAGVSGGPGGGASPGSSPGSSAGPSAAVSAGALLVADDVVALSLEDGIPMARAPERLAGLLEVRGVGILPVPHVAAAPVRLAVRLGQPGPHGVPIKGGILMGGALKGGASSGGERLPEPETEELALGDHVVRLPLIRLNGFEASAPAKVRLALAAVAGGVPFVPDAFTRVEKVI